MAFAGFGLQRRFGSKYRSRRLDIPTHFETAEFLDEIVNSRGEGGSDRAAACYSLAK